MYFNVSGNEFEAVCEVANIEDITFGQALAMLITKGLESIKNELLEEATDDTTYSTDT